MLQFQQLLAMYHSHLPAIHFQKNCTVYGYHKPLFYEEKAVLALDGDAGGGMQHILVLFVQHGVLHGDVVIRIQADFLFCGNKVVLRDVMRHIW